MRNYIDFVLQKVYTVILKGGDDVMKYKKDKNNKVQVRLTDGDLLLIDEIAAREKRTRSEVIRLLISRGVDNGKENQKIAI